MENYIVTRVGDDKGTYLYHSGTKGMKWGQRLYQNKDGSLTPLGRLRYGSGGPDKPRVSRKVRKQREANLQKAREAKAAKAEEKKTIEETRKKLLNSSDAKEIYENRHLLTTAELNDRINRIDTEAKLSSKISQDQQKTGLDKFNDMMTKSSKTIDNVTGLYRSVDNAYSTVANSAIGKMVAKQLGIEPPKKEFNAVEMWKNRNKLSNKEIQDLNQRLQNERNIENEMNRRNKKTEEEAARKRSEQQAKQAEKEAKKAAKEANKAEKESKQAANAEKQSNKTTEPKTERYKATADDIIGEGTSKFRGWSTGKTVNAKAGRDYWDVTEDVQTTALSVYTSPSRKETYSLGQNYIAGLLEDKNR